MDWDTIELNWERYKNLVREKWHKIPEAVFQNLGGSRERLIRAIEQAYDHSNEQARREVDHWLNEVPKLADEMAEMGARSRSRAAAEIRALAEGTSTRIEEGRQRFADLREQASARGEVAVRQVRGQVQAHPAATLALAIGVGMLLGHLMMRRR
jgi:ElaB/YqjD/DUF883 family membrane-anchored ribosome-binding protein